MSDLQTYDIDPNDPFASGIAAVDRKAGEPLPKLKPGMYVEAPGRGGFGMVVAATDTQASVLWSQAPRTVPENFAAPTLPLPKRAQAWAHDRDAGVVDMFDRGFVSKAYIREQFDLEETYNSFELTNEQLDAMGGKATFHQDGDVTVTRTVDELPAYVRPEDVRRRRSRY